MSENQSVDSNRLIQERKAEKQDVLRQRLQQKLEMIRQRQGSPDGENIKPFPVGTLEKLRSNNVWRNILDYITEPSNISNLYYLCGLFSEILVEKMELLLLSDALRVLEKKVTASATEAICLNLRGTSKNWKKVAEVHLFESSFSGESWYLNIDKNIEMPWLPVPIPRMCIFGNEESVDLAITSLSTRDPSFNLSLIRKVYVDESRVPIRDLRRFHQKIIQFFKNHGKSVWLLEFSTDLFPGRRLAQVYFRLSKILQLVPNLKALILDGATRILNEIEEHRVFQLHEWLKGHPFPVLPSLQHLHCVYVEDDVFLTQIFQSCVNLKSVVYTDRQIVSEEMVAALGKLTLDHLDEHWQNNMMSIRQRLPLILVHRMDWPLIKLILDLRGPFGSVSASELFPALNKFQDTLQHLSLWVSNFGIEIDTGLRLELPNLKYLWMDSIGVVGRREGMELWLGFDHLFSLKSLEKVVILQEVRDNVNGHVKIESHLEGNNMDHSNVWACFPNLLIIEHRCKIYKQPRQI